MSPLEANDRIPPSAIQGGALQPAHLLSPYELEEERQTAVIFRTSTLAQTLARRWISRRRNKKGERGVILLQSLARRRIAQRNVSLRRAVAVVKSGADAFAFTGSFEQVSMEADDIVEQATLPRAKADDSFSHAPIASKVGLSEQTGDEAAAAATPKKVKSGMCVLL